MGEMEGGRRELKERGRKVSDLPTKGAVGYYKKVSVVGTL